MPEPRSSPLFFTAGAVFCGVRLLRSSAAPRRASPFSPLLLHPASPYRLFRLFSSVFLFICTLFSVFSSSTSTDVLHVCLRHARACLVAVPCDAHAAAVVCCAHSSGGSALVFGLVVPLNEGHMYPSSLAIADEIFICRCESATAPTSPRLYSILLYLILLPAVVLFIIIMRYVFAAQPIGVSLSRWSAAALHWRTAVERGHFHHIEKKKSLVFLVHLLAQPSAYHPKIESGISVGGKKKYCCYFVGGRRD